MSPFHEKVVALRTAVPVGSVQGTLALDLEPQCDPPAPDPVRSRLGGDVVPIDRNIRGRLEHWSRRYAQAAVEIVGGDRPVTQLLRWSSRDVYADLARRAHLVALTHGTGRGDARPPVRPQVLGVRTCVVAHDAAEVSAHVRYGCRSRAVALRFEYRGDRWICVALDFA